jgi:hypothetical protein
MKTKHAELKTTITAMLLSLSLLSQNKPTIAVLTIDSKGMINDAREMGFIVRLELEKTGQYAVLDKYEVNQLLMQHKVDVNNCYSKSCLADAGKILNSDKMLSGSVERFGEKIIISLRIIDVATGTIERSNVTEYLNLPEIQKMVNISIKKLLGIEADPEMVKLLIDYDVPVESPKNTLRLNGPRMGFGTTMGNSSGILTGVDKAHGEFGMFPVNFQFGWQQEFQYISAGEFQALVENFFTIGGLESGRFVPSYSPLLGFRFGKGWEFGFGPNFRLVTKANGFYDTNDSLQGGRGQWYLSKQWTRKTPNPYTTEERLDSRGEVSLSTGLVIAIGKTFKSGYLNIPVNVFIAPRTDGTTIGAMFGFNIQKKKKIE